MKISDGVGKKNQWFLMKTFLEIVQLKKWYKIGKTQSNFETVSLYFKNELIIAKYVVLKYNSFHNLLIIKYIVYMNINSLAYIICCIFFVNPPYKYGYFYHFMFSTVSTWKKLLYVCSSANQTQVNVKDANYSAESILKRWEREAERGKLSKYKTKKKKRCFI